MLISQADVPGKELMDATDQRFDPAGDDCAKISRQSNEQTFRIERVVKGETALHPCECVLTDDTTFRVDRGWTL